MAGLPVPIGGSPVLSATRLDISKWLAISSVTAPKRSPFSTPREMGSPVFLASEQKLQAKLQ